MTIKETINYLNAIIRSDVVRPELKEKAVNELNRLQFEEAMRAIAA
jgi:hypothetical protein